MQAGLVEIRKSPRENYEEGMSKAFVACNSALKPEGRMVVAFANKQPDALGDFSCGSNSRRFCG